MRLLFLTAVAIGVSAPGAVAADFSPLRDMPVFDPTDGSPKSCPPTSRYEAARRGKAVRAQKLNALPAGDLYLAVDRRIGRCPAPIIVRYNIGAEPERTSGRR
jgi:hypothetical protein